MGRLKSALTSKYAERDIPLSIHTPRNTETVELHFRGEKTAKIIGSLATEPAEGKLIQGILASKDFSFTIIAPIELDQYTELVTSSIIQRQTVKTHSPFGIIKWHLEQMYGPLEKSVTSLDSANDSYLIFNAVTLTSFGKENNGSVSLEWDSDPINDMIADSVVTVVLQAEISPASVKVTKSSDTHNHSHEHSHDHSPKPNDNVETAEEKCEHVSTIKINEPLKAVRPSLSKLIQTHLQLSFGIDNIKRVGDVWTITIDEEKAIVELIDDKTWVIY
jgi:cleavage and polyadenylation specificity factor subunit 3